MGDNSKNIKKPETDEKKLKPHERPKFDYDNFDWPTERENYKRLCRGDEMLTYEVTWVMCTSYNTAPKNQMQSDSVQYCTEIIILTH